MRSLILITNSRNRAATANNGLWGQAQEDISGCAHWGGRRRRTEWRGYGVQRYFTWLLAKNERRMGGVSECDVKVCTRAGRLAALTSVGN